MIVHVRFIACPLSSYVWAQPPANAGEARRSRSAAAKGQATWLDFMNSPIAEPLGRWPSGLGYPSGLVAMLATIFRFLRESRPAILSATATRDIAASLPGRSL